MKVAGDIPPSSGVGAVTSCGAAGGGEPGIEVGSLEDLIPALCDAREALRMLAPPHDIPGAVQPGGVR